MKIKHIDWMKMLTYSETKPPPLIERPNIDTAPVTVRRTFFSC